MCGCAILHRLTTNVQHNQSMLLFISFLSLGEPTVMLRQRLQRVAMQLCTDRELPGANGVALPV